MIFERLFHVIVFLVLQPFWFIFHIPLAGFSLLIRGFFITHNNAPQSVGLLWKSDQSVAENSTWQHTTFTTDKHPCPGGIQTHNLSGRAAVDPRLRPRSHWDWPFRVLIHVTRAVMSKRTACRSVKVTTWFIFRETSLVLYHWLSSSHAKCVFNLLEPEFYI